MAHEPPFFALLDEETMDRVTSASRREAKRNPITGATRVVEVPGPPRFRRWRDAIEAAPKASAPEHLDRYVRGVEPYDQKGWTAYLVRHVPDLDEDPALGEWCDEIGHGAYVWLVTARGEIDD